MRHFERARHCKFRSCATLPNPPSADVLRRSCRRNSVSSGRADTRSSRTGTDGAPLTEKLFGRLRIAGRGRLLSADAYFRSGRRRCARADAVLQVGREYQELGAGWHVHFCCERREMQVWGSKLDGSAVTASDVAGADACTRQPQRASPASSRSGITHEFTPAAIRWNYRCFLVLL